MWNAPRRCFAVSCRYHYHKLLKKRKRLNLHEPVMHEFRATSSKISFFRWPFSINCEVTTPLTMQLISFFIFFFPTLSFSTKIVGLRQNVCAAYSNWSYGLHRTQFSSPCLHHLKKVKVHRCCVQSFLQKEGQQDPSGAKRGLFDDFMRRGNDMSPLAQLFVTIAAYIFHMLFLSKNFIPFHVQLIPNQYGLFQSVGLDSLAGFCIVALALHRWIFKAEKPVTSRLTMPWNLDTSVKAKIPMLNIYLVVAYYFSGWLSLGLEYVLYGVASLGIPITVAMHRSLQVLLSHLIWVLMGTSLLGRMLRPFFENENGNWYKLKRKTLWVWWVVGGYYVSSFLFNMADVANQFLFPINAESESVVARIINPEDNDIAALAIGSIAPCISAPWWEEILYRGYLLPALTLYFRRTVAIPLSALLFAAHHLSIANMVPLTVLGLFWSALYVLSGNIFVTILIHAMWNSRVFLGSLLGV